MQENNIVGRIIVENNSVRQIFMDNLESLTEALEESGFESASLDVSLGNDQGQGTKGEETTPFYSERVRELDEAVPVLAFSEDGTRGHINLVM